MIGRHHRHHQCDVIRQQDGPQERPGLFVAVRLPQGKTLFCYSSVFRPGKHTRLCEKSLYDRNQSLCTRISIHGRIDRTIVCSTVVGRQET